MSLLCLPDELLAGVAGYLEFTDSSSLKLSCRRIYTVIKKYKLDKPNIRELSISKVCNKLEFDVIYCCPQKKPERVFVVAANEMLAKTAGMINKCRSIQKLKLHNFTINQSLVSMFDGISVKIRKIHCELGSVELDAAGFVAFCKSFKATTMRNVDLKPEHITDEIFSQILPNTFIHYGGGIPIHTELTDVTFNALISDEDIQCRFMIGNFANKFTTEGIEKLIQTVIDTDEIGLQWNLGILSSNQEVSAARLAEKVSSMPGCPFDVLRRVKNGCTTYEINQKPKGIDYDAWNIEEFKDLYDICVDGPDSVGTIEFSIANL